MKFWKSDLEKYEDEMNKAFDARNKGKIDETIEHFMKAYELAVKSRDENMKERAQIAYSYATFYKALRTRSGRDFEEAYKAVSALKPDVEFDLALPRKIKAGELAEDLRYLSIIYSLPPVDLSNLSKYSPEDAGRYDEAAKDFVSKNGRRFTIEDLVDIHDTFESIGYRFLAISKMIAAAHAEGEDPDKAVQIYTEALGYLNLAAHADQLVKKVNDRISKLSKATRCWICQRPIQGEEVNFIYLDTFTTKYILKKYGGEDQMMLQEGRVAVCAVCYGSIYKLSDKISKYYYDKAVEEMRRLEERLMAQIAALRSEVEILRASIASVRVGYRRSGPGI
uniref:Uncharacterized protein n=1 Tax=Thermogladius calderae TaxID=1200300 RepID=A0A7J3XZK6_9CREN